MRMLAWEQTGHGGGHRANARIEKKRSGFEMARLAKAISFCITETFRVAMRPGDTPVPIPNTMVKTWTADGTMLETAWERRHGRAGGCPVPFQKKRSRRCETEGKDVH